MPPPSCRSIAWLFLAICAPALLRPVAAQEATQPEVGTALWALEQLRPVDGFEKSLFAAEPLVKDPVSFCIDEKGQVYVAESFRQEDGVEDNRSSSWWLMDDLAAQTVEDRLAMYQKWAHKREGGMEYYSRKDDQVRRLRDTDGDGVADVADDFALGFNEPLDGTGAGLIARDGRVWYTNIPHLWRLEDRDGDGVAEIRDRVHSGFGVRIALRGHDMHGLVWGPDGRLYWSIGDRGYSVETPEGHRYHSPGAGAVFRCEPDGSNLEVVHHGLRNPQELAFDRHGNLFTGDNNSDGGDRARLVYIVEGGETGWNMAYQTLEGDNRRGPWNQEGIWKTRHDEQPAWTLPPITNIASGPSGLVYYPGMGLPPRYEGHFLLCDFRGATGNSRVLSFALESDGAGFRAIDEHVFVDQVLCTDVDFGFDGRVYISDWGKGWVSNGEGRIYCVADPTILADPLVSEVARIFAEGFEDRGTAELCDLLRHPDMRLRLRAQFVLAERGVEAPPAEPGDDSGEGRSVEMMSAMVADEAEDPLARIHAIWGLGIIARRLDDGAPLAAVLPCLRDEDPEVRAQAARVLGDKRHRPAAGSLLAALTDESPRVRFFAAMGLGKLRHRQALPAIIDMLRANDDSDVYLRHAGVMALTWMADLDRVLEYAADESEAVQLAILLVLRRAEDPRVASFLASPNLSLVTEAARAINDVPIPGAMPALARAIHRFAPAGSSAEPHAPTTTQELEAPYLVEIFRDVAPVEWDTLLDHPAFARKPDETHRSKQFAGPVDHADHYASRVSGLVTAPASGDYFFFIGSDDDSELYLGTGEDPASMRRIASVEGWVARDAWEQSPSQRSDAVRLEAGRSYWLEARHLEGQGGDHLAVGWQLPSGALERPIGGPLVTRGREVPLMRRMINACFRLGGAENAGALLDLAGCSDNPPSMRREALQALADWQEPSPRDRVNGFYRAIAAGTRDVEAVRDLLGERLPGMLGRASGGMLADALRVAARLGVDLGEPTYSELLSGAEQPAEVRVLALEQLVGAGGAARDAALEDALAADDARVRSRAYELVAATGSDEGLAQQAAVLADPDSSALEKQGAIGALASAGTPQADAILVALMKAFLADELAPELHLDILEAARSSASTELQAARATYLEKLPPADPLAPFFPALAGGDPEKGREVVTSSIGAGQCLRCHMLDGTGGDSAPDLSHVASRLSPEKILESLVSPQAETAQGFGQITAMPPMGLILQPRDLRDLIAYLKTLD